MVPSFSTNRLNARGLEAAAAAADMDCSIKVRGAAGAAGAAGGGGRAAAADCAVREAPHSFLLLQNFLFLPVRGCMSAL